MKQCWKYSCNKFKTLLFPVSVFYPAISISLFCTLSWLFSSSLKSLSEAPCCSPVCQLASCSCCAQFLGEFSTLCSVYGTNRPAFLLHPRRVSGLPELQFGCLPPMTALQVVVRGHSDLMAFWSFLSCHQHTFASVSLPAPGLGCLSPSFLQQSQNIASFISKTESTKHFLFPLTELHKMMDGGEASLSQHVTDCGVVLLLLGSEHGP